MLTNGLERASASTFEETTWLQAILARSGLSSRKVGNNRGTVTVTYGRSGGWGGLSEQGLLGTTGDAVGKAWAEAPSPRSWRAPERLRGEHKR